MVTAHAPAVWVAEYGAENPSPNGKSTTVTAMMDLAVLAPSYGSHATAVARSAINKKCFVMAVCSSLVAA
jgi:hypothetical protein